MHENAKAALQRYHESGQKAERKNPLEKLDLNRTSLRLAVNARCYQCMGENHDPGVNKRIADCNSEHCALYHVRPYK